MLGAQPRPQTVASAQEQSAQVILDDLDQAAGILQTALGEASPLAERLVKTT